MAEWCDFVPRCRYKYGVTKVPVGPSKERPGDSRNAAPDQTVLSRRGRIVAELRAIVPGEGVIAPSGRCGHTDPTA